MIKALFITHDISIYGASRSLQTLLRNYSVEGVEIDLMINRRLLRHNDLENVRAMFGPYICDIHQAYLPFELCEVGKPKPNAGLALKNLLYKINRSRLLAWIRERRYDAVYLNSIVMHSLIEPDVPFVIHVREIYDFSQASVVDSLRKARGIIFIDDSTEKPFSNLGFTHSIVLNNPFDMKAVTEISKGLKRFKDEKRTVISMIGKIKESKGNEFVIEALLRSRNKDRAVLLMVGRADEKDYLERCKLAASGSDNIIFFGEEAEISNVYQVSDFIIRGEAYPAIGRTIFEGLYSGCHAIIPGTQDDFAGVFSNEFDAFVHIYRARDSGDLSSLFDELIGTKVVARTFHSNASQYVEAFHAFLMRSISNTRS